MELLKQISDTNLDMWVVTGSSKPNLKEDIVEDFDNAIPLDKIITGRDVRIGKPSAEPYMIALHESGMKPGETIVIENAPLGVESARMAGLFTLVVNTGPLDDDIFHKLGAKNIFKNCQELSESWIRIVEVLGQ
jgi:beta-phosphoglucomutase-like phosphatase (HAD superfamily)